MKINNIKSVIAVIFIMPFVLGYMYVRDCRAQSAGSFDKMDKSYVGIGDDLKSYQILEYRNDKDYIAYSRVVRERIKRKLEDGYRYYYNDGDVSLFFIIRADGKLAKFYVDPGTSTADKKLIDIAISSLNRASPFSPFPKRLSAAQLPFFVTISFKEK